MKGMGSPYEAYSRWKIWLLFKITGMLGVCVNVVPPYWLEQTDEDKSQ